MTRETNNQQRLQLNRRSVLKAAAITGVGLSGATAYAGTAGAQTCSTTVSPGDSIQTAINNASVGDTICLESGTYTEDISINTAVTIEGEGPANTTIEGSGSKTVTLQSTNISLHGFTITNTGGGNGIDVPSTVDASGLHIENVDISETSIGFFNDRATGGPTFSGVLFRDVSITNSERKGIYTEALANATIEDTVIDGVNSPTYGFNSGIDINLKYGDYDDVSIRNTTVRNVAEGDPFLGNSRFPTGITIKARQDGGYGSNPATLSNVVLESLTVEDTPNGIRFGEPGKSSYGLEDATVTTSDILDNSDFGLINETPVEVDARENWWGHASGPGGPDGRRNPAGKEVGMGDDIVGSVAFDPWLRRPKDHPSR